MTKPNMKRSVNIRIHIKYIFSYIVIGIALILSSCGITPYRSEFSCSLRDDFGKCISVDGAYEEAVTGVDSGASSLSRKGASVHPKSVESASQVEMSKGATQSDSVGIQIANVSSNVDQYGAYRSSVYEQMRSMLTSPSSPILRPASTVRTLIISYSNKEQGNRLYMPRYVFSISGSPEFLHGSYLDRRPNSDQLIDARAVAMERFVK